MMNKKFYSAVIVLIAASILACGPAEQGGNDSGASSTDVSNTEETGNQEEALSQQPSLDLNLVSDPDAAIDTAQFSEKSTLPDLFDKKSKEKKVSVGGKPLRDATNPDLVNSLEGAEVSIEIKTP